MAPDRVRVSALGRAGVREGRYVKLVRYGMVLQSCNNKYCHNGLIFSHGKTVPPAFKTIKQENLIFSFSTTLSSYHNDTVVIN